MACFAAQSRNYPNMHRHVNTCYSSSQINLISSQDELAPKEPQLRVHKLTQLPVAYVAVMLHHTHDF